MNDQSPPNDEQRSPDEPVSQPEHVDSPAEGAHLSSPEAGHPAGETSPTSGLPEQGHAHPEDIGDSPSDEEGEEPVTES